jgi:hypothetical protein
MLSHCDRGETLDELIYVMSSSLSRFMA